MSYLDMLREIDDQKIFASSPIHLMTKPTKAPSVSSVSTPRGLSVKFHNDRDAAKPEKLGTGDPAHRGWLFHFSDHDPRECYFTPMVTHAEALAAMPEAIAAEPLATVVQSTCPSMSTKDEQAIRAWLELIGEADSTVIADVIGKCLQDADALAYFLERAEVELPKPDSQFEDDRHTCDQCANLIARRCRIAEPVQGSKVVANHSYKPNPSIKVRCAGYQTNVTGEAA